MRLLILLASNVCLFSASANAADSIAPGMSLRAAFIALDNNGYDVDTIEYGLQISPSNEKLALEFCRIDDDITLALAFDKSTKQITSMSIYIYPDPPSTQKPYAVSSSAKYLRCD